jgi:hypothetical protein
MMKEKKHIDRLFNERFKDFEASPPPEVWDRIKAKLKEEEEDRKIIPIWWKLGGVAALLGILFVISQLFFTGVDQTTEESWATEDPAVEQSEGQSTDKVTTRSESIADTEGNSPDLKEGSSGDLQEGKESAGFQGESTSEAIANTTSETSTRQAPSLETKEARELTENAIAVQQEQVGAPDNTARTNTVSGEGGDIPSSTDASTVVSQTTAIAQVDQSADKGSEASQVGQKNELDKAIQSPTEMGEPSVEDAIAVQEPVAEKTTEAEEKETGRSIQDAIQEQQDALAQSEKEVNKRSWEVTPNLAPVYYSSLGEGSSIDPTFADNPQTGDVNLSYGVLVGYQLSERLTIRTGVNNVNVGYSTGGVEFATGPVSSALRSVDYNQTGSTVLSAYDSGSIRPAAPGTENDPFENITLKSTSPDAEIIQNITYFEVPMELKYALLDKRVGINMIGGFSTLFLGDNEVAVRDGDFRSTLGEANNLNNLSFSTNVGVGFDYKFSKSFRFVLEPMFKYQLNPYSDSSVDFRPYYLGVYSGLSFKF